MIEFIHNYSYVVSWISSIVFILLQLYFFWDTAKCRRIFSDFFKRTKNYSTYERRYEEELIPMLFKAFPKVEEDKTLPDSG